MDTSALAPFVSDLDVLGSPRGEVLFVVLLNITLQYFTPCNYFLF